MTTPAPDGLQWFWIATSWACGGVATDDAGIVRDAAPIFRRTALGKPLNDVIRQWRQRGAVRWERLPGDWEVRA